MLLTLLFNWCSPVLEDFRILGIGSWWCPEVLIFIFYHVERIHELSLHFWPCQKVGGLASDLSQSNVGLKTDIAVLERSQLDIVDRLGRDCRRRDPYRLSNWWLRDEQPGFAASGHRRFVGMQRKTSDFFERYSEAFKRDPGTTPERDPTTGEVTYVWKPHARSRLHDSQESVPATIWV